MSLKKKFLIFIVLISVISGCKNKEKESSSELRQVEESEQVAGDPSSEYDAKLAERLHADDYGMKKYIFALLKAGPNRDQDSTTAAGIQRAHLDNITRLANEGKLVAAGPFLEEGEFQGIFVFNVETVGEALELTNTDPAVQAGRLVFEFHPWYSSATLQLISEWHKKVAKVSI